MFEIRDGSGPTVRNKAKLGRNGGHVGKDNGRVQGGVAEKWNVQNKANCSKRGTEAVSARQADPTDLESAAPYAGQTQGCGTGEILLSARSGVCTMRQRQ